MAGICFLLGFISVLYFLGIWRMTGLSSRFPLVWLFFSGSFFLAGSCILLEIEVPIWLGVFIGIFGGGFSLLLVFTESFIIRAMHQKGVKDRIILWCWERRYREVYLVNLYSIVLTGRRSI